MTLPHSARRFLMLTLTLAGTLHAAQAVPPIVVQASTHARTHAGMRASDAAMAASPRAQAGTQASAQANTQPSPSAPAPRAPLATRWAAEVKPDAVLPEYPRPQLTRAQWLNLNGHWDYAIRPKEEPRPSQWDGRILVPFAAESALSGVMKEVGSANRLWYRREFTPAADWRGQRLLLHFGAVDWHTIVSVNGQQVGEHRGGYDPFTFDITTIVKADGPNEIVVSVWDPTDEGEQPRGKQVRRPRSIWYTAVTGIWQTVWIEPVPDTFIDRVRIQPDADRQRVRFDIVVGGAAQPRVVDVTVKGEGGRTVAERRGAPSNAPIELAVPNVRRWSPTSPFLYQVEIALRDAAAAGGSKSGGGSAGAGAAAARADDRVGSYFGMRTIAMKKDARGVNRLFLNGEPLFQMGPLDQGWWPDGLYTAPTDAALKYDLDVTKQLGFNMVRKHTKVEPARWYYWCDTLGLLVWQDMPSAFAPARPAASTTASTTASTPAASAQAPASPAPTQTAEGHAQFERELAAMMAYLGNVPSIVMWVPFNEGWGQYDTARIAKLVKEADPTRLVNESSGWDNYGSGDTRDVHEYPGPSTPPIESTRVAVLGEYGGLGLVLDDHLWQKDANWGYRSFKTRAELNDQYAARIEALRPLIAHGLAAAVYTQTTDVEIEVNGFMTYDRAVTKLDADRVRALHESLYRPAAPSVTVLPMSPEGTAPGGKGTGALWRYTTSEPPATWFETTFADAAWTEAPGPFGKTGAPVPDARTPWTTDRIWLRRTFTLDKVPAGALYLLLRHDEDATVYVNGQKIAEVPGSTSHYAPVEATTTLRAALKAGPNVIAVHCRQTKGDQFIDAGIVAYGGGK